MKGWQMYSNIQAMKEQGFSIRQIAKIKKISRNTVKKYWEMEPEEYAEKFGAANRTTALAAYEGVVVKWLETYPCMTAAQVCYWLAEKHRFDASDRTVRKYVAKLRAKHGITKETEPKRDYEAVEELPMGHQLQLDFGEKTVRSAYSSRYVKLYFAVFTLSYSRYKWGVFQDRPFLSSDLVNALYQCFDYFGGKPRQLVYDQDSIIVATENGGDIIHTKTFAAFLSESKLEVRVCRKSDPETKGIVEASVKYVKGNFMENRHYMGLDAWNKSFEDWLVRTGNRKQHGTTKRKPADMFDEEREHLLPLYGIAPAAIADGMDRQIRPDNTVWYKSNRYSVPYGTYNKGRAAFLEVAGGRLKIISEAGDLLADHEVSLERGKLIKLGGHRKKRGEKTAELREKTIALLGEEFRGYLEAICKRMPRYAKEQIGIVTAACGSYGRETALAAMRHCEGLGLHSANDLRGAAETIGGQAPPLPRPTRLPIEDERCHIHVQTRALSVYAGIAAESGVEQ